MRRTVRGLLWEGARFLLGIVLVASSADPPPAIASTDLTEVARATFSDVADGPGDGKSFPAEVGKVSTLVPLGKALKDIAPLTGVAGHRVCLSDVGTLALNNFGIRVTPTVDATKTALISFELRQESDVGLFLGEVSDGSTSDALAGDVGDGTTTDSMAITVDDGKVTINSHSYKIKVNKGANYRFELGLYDNVNGLDLWEARVTNLDTGETEYQNDVLANGFKPVHQIDLKKKLGKAGAFSVDAISMSAQ